MPNHAKTSQSVHKDKKKSSAKLVDDFVQFSKLANAKDQNLFELAQRIAKELDDQKNLGLYLHYCRRYPLSVIRYAFEEAMRRKPEEIKKSRGALFTYIVKFMTKGRNHDS